MHDVDRPATCPSASSRGVSTRVIWMSRANCSWPTPIGNTGIDRAFRLASGSSSEASEVSAPSVTITSPASGSPASSSRARSSAWPRCVEVPAYFRSPAPASRSADDEKRKKRSTNRCDSAVEQRAVGLAELLLHELGARLPVAIGDRHAARVVDQDAEKILLRDRRLQNQRRAEQAEQQQRHHAEPQRDQHQRGRAWPVAGDAAVGDQRGERGHGQRREAEGHRARGGKREVALLEDQRRVLEENLNSEPMTGTFYSTVSLRRVPSAGSNRSRPRVSLGTLSAA